METNDPLVSIAITTYNRANLVGRAIESVVKQSYKNLELVVVDDGSTDDTQAVLRLFADQDDRIKIVHSSENLGVNGAKNKALDSVSGEYTALLDSDDELLPDAISTFVTMFKEHGPEYGMMVCNAVDPHTGEWTGLGVSEDSDLTYQDALCGRWKGDFTGVWRTSVMSDLRFATDEAAKEVNVWNQVYKRWKVYYKHAAVRNYYRDTAGSEVAIRYDRGSARKRTAATQSFVRMYGSDIRRECPQCLAAPHREIVLYASLAGKRATALRSAINAVRFEFVTAHLRLLAVPLMPRFVFLWVLRRYFSAKGAKIL
jgi:glycosyltransferase involved in cell wall biosynthesis